MGLCFRYYTGADKEACLAVFDSNIPDFFRAQERADFAAFLDQLPCPYFVMEDESKRIIACGGYAPARCRLCWGMVAHPYHRKGVGRLLLLARLRHWYRHQGASRVTLATSQSSAGFFERAGFVTRRIIEDGHAPGLHCYEMGLSLDQEWSDACIRDLREDQLADFSVTPPPVEEGWTA